MTKMPEPEFAPEKFDLRSLDLAVEKRAELLRLFPEAAAEGGKIDFERLRLALGDQVEVGRERYGMNWPDKAACFQTIQRPSLATLRPKVEESVDFDTTENVIIEGDNLEVLKLLQKSYLGKVKMIYIDPPYNTGNDFIYPDNYSESLQTYLEYTGQVDGEGRKFSTNTDADGRFHSKWLNMMYPRLYLARNLLTETGIVFISIDDGEESALHHLCNEVFGEANHVATLVWKKSYGGGAKVKHVVGLHEFVVMYCRNKESLPPLELPPDPEVLKYYKFRDEKAALRGPYRLQPLATTSMDDRPNLRFAILWQGEEIWPEKQWQWAADRTMAALAQDELVITKCRERWVVDYKQYLRDEQGNERPSKMFSLLDGPYTQAGTEALRDLGLDSVGFAFPKPVGLVSQLLETSGKDSIVLDFFAGSGTTAHAVLEQNQKDGGNRKFILVQLPEPTSRPEYPTIADITKERVRRVIKKLNDADKGQLRSANEPKPDRGFRVFQLAPSNFKPWDGAAPKDKKALQKQLVDYLEHILPDRSDQDLLYEILLKDGFPLTTPIEPLALHGFRVFSVAGGQLLLCLQEKLTRDLILALADRRPSRIVLLDRGFRDNDQLKANAAKILAKAGVEKFETV